MAKHDAYLVLNAGSSSLKFSVFRKAATSDDLETLLSGQISGIGSQAYRAMADEFLARHAVQRELQPA